MISRPLLQGSDDAGGTHREGGGFPGGKRDVVFYLVKMEL